jgi:hypothetical protein
MAFCTGRACLGVDVLAFGAVCLLEDFAGDAFFDPTLLQLGRFRGRLGGRCLLRRGILEGILRSGLLIGGLRLRSVCRGRASLRRCTILFRNGLDMFFFAVNLLVLVFASVFGAYCSQRASWLLATGRLRPGVSSVLRSRLRLGVGQGLACLPRRRRRFLAG